MLRRLVIGLITLGCSAVAFAQGYPNKTVKIVVPFAAGSATDGLARVLAEELSRAFKVSFVVDNRAGASAIIGTEVVARAAPDGYTLLVTSNTSHSSNPSLFKKLPYDPIKDFAPVSRIGALPFVLVVNADLPVTTLPELIAHAKANPGKLSYATSNSTSLVAAETIKVMAGVDIVGVPYKANPQALQDLVHGQVHLMVCDAGTSRPLISAGKLRALGVTPKQRTRMFPGMQSIAEAGLPGYDLIAWAGMFAPARTPPDIVNKLHAEMAKILARKHVQERLAFGGYEVMAASPKEFDAFVKQQLAYWRSKIQAAGIQPE